MSQLITKTINEDRIQCMYITHNHTLHTLYLDVKLGQGHSAVDPVLLDEF